MRQNDLRGHLRDVAKLAQLCRAIQRMAHHSKHGRTVHQPFYKQQGGLLWSTSKSCLLTVKSVEALADPVYVCWQTRNGILIRCDKRDAQGVMSGDGNTIYQLQGKQLSGVESDELLSAVSITLAEYEELAAQVGTTDPDDDTPVNPPDDPGTEILPRAQLTEKVLALEDELAAAKILLGVTDE